jgi:hypothetical protein
MLQASEPDVPLKPPHNQKVCRVRNMEINFFTLGEGHESDLRIVGKMLRRMVEYLQVLTIRARRYQYILPLFTDTGFPLLVSIIIMGPPGSMDDALDDGTQLEQLRIPSPLQCLDISGPVALLDMFGSTTVTNIRFVGRENLTLKASRLSEWSNLRVLNLSFIESSFDHFSSPTLKVLSIRVPRNMATVTALCQQLAITVTDARDWSDSSSPSVPNGISL